MRKYFLILCIFSTTFCSFASFERKDIYKSRNEFVERRFSRIDNYIFVKVLVKDLKSNKLKRKTFNFFKVAQEDVTHSDCVNLVVDSLTLNETDQSNFSKFISFNEKFHKTKYGVLVDKQCTKRVSKKYFEGNLLLSYQKGVSCLKKLGTKASNDILQRINKLFKDKNNPPKIFCGESEFEVKKKGLSWKTAKAYASPNKTFEFHGMQHPFISLDPKGSWNFNEYDMQGTLFHELLHNTGFIHTETIERPYSCQSCCFNLMDKPNLYMNLGKNAQKEKDAACKLCKSEYEGITDKKYIKDFVTFRALGAQRHRIFSILKNYMKEAPNDDFAIKEFIRAEKLYGGEIGEKLQQVLKNKKLDESDELGNFAKAIVHFSRKEYSKAADFIKGLDKYPSPIVNYELKNIFDEIKKDLLFISFTDNSFDMQASQNNDLFKFLNKASKKF